MTDTLAVDFTMNGRRVSFKLARDPRSMTDLAIINQLQHYGMCEPEVVQIMTRAVRPGDTVVDGGANVGFFSLLLARLVGDKGAVYAYEPDAKNCERLTASNLASGRLPWIKLFRRALWSRKDKAVLNLSPDNGQHSVGAVEGMTGSVVIDTTVLDEIEVTPRLIKLDIEGAEEQALRGAERHLAAQACPYIIVELNLKAMKALNSTQEGLRHFMYGFGYATFLLHKDGSYPAQVPLGTEIRPVFANCNILFSTPKNVAELYPTTGIT
jgi:FkbM family methyltransferase